MLSINSKHIFFKYDKITCSFQNLTKHFICFVLYFLDLELAAAIGKNLLERNKELESLLCSTQEYAEEQVKKSQVSNQ